MPMFPEQVRKPRWRGTDGFLSSWGILRHYPMQDVLEARSLRRQFAIVAASILTLITLCAFLGFSVLFQHIKGQVTTRQAMLSESLADVSSIAMVDYGVTHKKSITLLKNTTLKLGEPKLGPERPWRNLLIPDLIFGKTSVLGDKAMVAHVKATMGSGASLLVRTGNRLVRVSTTLTDEHGEGALGSELDPESPASQAVLAGTNYDGVCNAYGVPSITMYEPILSSSGEVLGAWAVGFPMSKVHPIYEHFAGAKLLQSGFFALSDNEGKAFFHSSHVTGQEVEKVWQAMKRKDPTYNYFKINAPRGDYFIFSAVPSTEIFRSAIHTFLSLSAWLLACLLIALLGVGILLLSIYRRERSFRLFTENMHDLVCLFSVDGKIRYISPASLRLLGERPQNVVGTQWLEWVHPEDHAEIQTAMNTPDSSWPRQVLEFRIKRKDGSYLWVEAVFRHEQDASGKVTEIQAAVRDVSETRQAEDLAFRLFQAVEQSGTTVLIADDKGKIEYVNQRTSDLTGFSEEELLGKASNFLLPGGENDTQRQQVRATTDLGEPWRGELETRQKDGRTFWQLVSASPIRDKSGNTTHFLYVGQDLTQIKEAEVQLREARKVAEESNQAKDEFLNIMSHELRTPLNGLLGYNGVLLQTELTAEQKDYVKTISECGERLLSLIDRMLQFSHARRKGASTVAHPFVPREMLSVCIREQEEHARAKGLTLEHFLDESVPELLIADHEHLKKIIDNLLENAISLTKTGGISLRAKTYRGGVGKLMLQIAVEDSGPGIEPRDMEKIFSPFSQLASSSNRRHQGIGLSLAMCRLFAQSMGGNITVQSQVGSGSTFFVDIPCSEETEEKKS